MLTIKINMMFMKGFTVPTILSLVLLVAVAAFAIYRTVVLKKQSAAIKEEGPKANTPEKLISTAFTSIQVITLLTTVFIVLFITAGSFVFSMLKERRVSMLTMYWMAVLAPVVLLPIYIGAAKLSQMITAKTVGVINNSMPPPKVVETAAGTTTPPATGVEGYRPYMMFM